MHYHIHTPLHRVYSKSVLVEHSLSGVALLMESPPSLVSQVMFCFSTWAHMFLALPGNSWLLSEPLEHLLGSRAVGRRSTLLSHCSLLHHHTWDIWFSFHDFNLLLTRTARSMSRWFVVMAHVFLEWTRNSQKKKKKGLFLSVNHLNL